MSLKRYFRILTMVAVVSRCAVLVNVGKTQPASAGQNSGPQPSSNPPAPKKAEEAFKNIQVLKGIPADQVFPTMQFITASLGVECDFCHVQNAFEKDDKKPKEIARKMMEMMFAINKDNFEGHREVTCYSCHRGNAKPVAIPAVMTEEPKAAVGDPHQPGGERAQAREANGPTAQQLIDKYVQASGGASAIDKVTSRVMKGTIDFGGRTLPIDIYSKNPEKRISFTHMSDGDSVTAFNGQEGWLGSPGRPLRDMRGSDLDAAAIDADLHLATHLGNMFSKMQVRGVEKIDDKDVYEVLGQREGKTPIRLYFDQQSGLLLRLVRFGDTALGWLPTEIDYADYREANGVKVPYRWTLARPSGKFTIQVSELNQNVPVDDGKFDRPASPPEPSKAATK
jgi:photosynthetic reaction center cytochrome c subunit